MKWIQLAVNDGWPTLEAPILEALPASSSITWYSPRRDDDLAEYSDADFLQLLEIGQLASELSAFWPRRGPQWDALGKTDAGCVLLVEAKAHVTEMESRCLARSELSRALIRRSLTEVMSACDAQPPGIVSAWLDRYYQIANRLAHLYFLRAHGIDAYLTIKSFLNDVDMAGPVGKSIWTAAQETARRTMGLPERHMLSSFIINVYPDVSDIRQV